MAPAKPPLPTPRERLFQLSPGSQTSKRIAESDVGCMMPATRQKAGRLCMGAWRPSIFRSPDVTDWARVMVVSASLRSLRAAQSAARREEEGRMSRHARMWGTLSILGGLFDSTELYLGWLWGWGERDRESVFSCIS